MAKQIINSSLECDLQTINKDSLGNMPYKIVFLSLDLCVFISEIKKPVDTFFNWFVIYFISRTVDVERIESLMSSGPVKQNPSQRMRSKQFWSFRPSNVESSQNFIGGCSSTRHRGWNGLNGCRFYHSNSQNY